MEPVFPRGIIVVILKGTAMKFTTIAFAAALALCGTGRYRSYDSGSGNFLGYDGHRHACR